MTLDVDAVLFDPGGHAEKATAAMERRGAACRLTRATQRWDITSRTS